MNHKLLSSILRFTTVLKTYIKIYNIASFWKQILYLNQRGNQQYMKCNITTMLSNSCSRTALGEEVISFQLGDIKKHTFCGEVTSQPVESQAELQLAILCQWDFKAVL